MKVVQIKMPEIGSLKTQKHSQQNRSRKKVDGIKTKKEKD